MHISKLGLINYRNFANAKLIFKKGTNTIIGENGSGKTNVFRAVRLLLDDNMIRAAHRLDETDFHRGLQNWRGHWIIISLEFEEISPDEAIQALFLHATGIVGPATVSKATYNLIFRPKMDIRLSLSQLEDGDHEGLAEIRKAITIGDYETIFTGRSEADFNDSEFYKRIVGDFENAVFSEETEFPEIGSKVSPLMAISKEVSFTFVQALRDVVSEFHNNRTNPLLTLLKGKSGEIDPEVFRSITDQVKNLNRSIEELEDVQTVKGDIIDTIKDAAGEAYSPTSMSIKSDLPEEAEQLFQSLKLFVGESGEGHEGPISELSLGGANLIYLTLKLLEFKYQKAKQTVANFLLIEEPEAHIHTHIQKTLFDKLDYDETQIIYSTHSTQISEVSNVENVNILGKSRHKCEAFQPTTGMLPDDVGNIQRYLDAVRSNLLFAKSVILVEGDAEEILIPIMVKKVLGISLDELGISLINIRSTGFKNVAVLFHEDRVRKRCSILTDLDASIIDTTPVAGDSEAITKFKEKCEGSATVGAARKMNLEAFVAGNRWLGLQLSDHTFEVDFVKAGNVPEVVCLVSKVYTDAQTITLAKSELESNDLAKFGKRVLTMANYEGKGWFAILLGKQINFQTVIPKYILDAIFFAHPVIADEVWFNIIKYRLGAIEASGLFDITSLTTIRTDLHRFRRGEISLAEIRDEIRGAWPSDQLNPILARFP
jgi:putative ATP-dependent endonuclease of OLD family